MWHGNVYETNQPFHLVMPVKNQKLPPKSITKKLNANSGQWGVKIASKRSGNITACCYVYMWKVYDDADKYSATTIRFEVSMLVKNHDVVLWVMTQHNLLGGYKCFRRTGFLHPQDTLMLQHIPPLVLLTLGNDYIWNMAFMSSFMNFSQMIHKEEWGGED